LCRIAQLQTEPNKNRLSPIIGFPQTDTMTVIMMMNWCLLC